MLLLCQSHLESSDLLAQGKPVLLWLSHLERRTDPGLARGSVSLLGLGDNPFQRASSESRQRPTLVSADVSVLHRTEHFLRRQRLNALSLLQDWLWLENAVSLALDRRRFGAYGRTRLQFFRLRQVKIGICDV